jgi:UDP-N-acetylmuramoylalanine--D-glutamate ligase
MAWSIDQHDAQERILAEPWKGRKVTVLGLARSGTSAAEYLLKRGARVLVSERSQAEGDKVAEVERLKKLGAEVETGGHSEQAISQCDLIVVSPGIPPNAEVLTRAQNLGKEVVCDIEIAYRETQAAEKRIPMIGITGTNGKSTTCALTSHILESAGYVAPSCGNIGIPILDQLERNPDFLVVEVSSFQLHYCPTFAPYIGVWLNLTPDHLEWHGSLEAYIADKQKMFNNQRVDQYAVMNVDDPIIAKFYPSSEVFPFSVESEQKKAIQAAFIQDDFLWYRLDGMTNMVCRRDELKIMGKHNLENALAAISITGLLRLSVDQIASGLKSFHALEHRLEFVATIDGVDFYNDSKATNPTSTIKALEAFGNRKIVLIAGGKDKGTPLDELVEAAHKHTTEVILLGEAKQRFHEAFEEKKYRNIHSVNSLEEAVELGRSLKRGPVVLSPACASFDMFKDYEDRGRVFKNLVNARLEKVSKPV